MAQIKLDLDLPDPTPSRSLAESVVGDSDYLSPAQKTFKKLLASVETAENKLKNTNDLREIYHPKFI